MNDYFDTEFSKLLQNSKFDLPDSYETHFNNVLEKIWNQREKKYYFLFRSKMVAVIALCVVSLSLSIGVGATINLYQQHMKNISDEEVDRYNADVQSSTAQADRFLRPLTQEEKDRMAQLRQEYETKGRFPQKEILQVQRASEVPTDTLCFCPANSTFYVPQKTMTDEELLQIIDIMEKRDYSVQKKNAGSEKRTTSAENENVTEDEAIQIAKEIIEKSHGVKTENAKTKVEFEVTDEFSKYYVEITNKDWDFEFVVDVDSSTGVVERVLAEHKTKETRVTGIKIKESNYKNYASEIENLYRELYPNDDIEKIWLSYNYFEDGTLSRGNVKYIVESSDNKGCVFLYSVNTGMLYDLYPITNIKNFKQGEKRIEKQNKKNGILRKKIEISFLKKVKKSSSY